MHVDSSYLTTASIRFNLVEVALVCELDLNISAAVSLCHSIKIRDCQHAVKLYYLQLCRTVPLESPPLLKSSMLCF